MLDPHAIPVPVWTQWGVVIVTLLFLGALHIATLKIFVVIVGRIMKGHREERDFDRAQGQRNHNQVLEAIRGLRPHRGNA